MKQQGQNARSTNVKQNTADNQDKETHQNKPQAKLKDVYELLGVRAYPWIFSKDLRVCVCVHLICPPTNYHEKSI